MYEKPDLVDAYVSKGGHDYRPDLRVAVFRWINKHLKGDTGPIKDADDKPLPGKELRVFPEDKDVPKDAVNGRIDETFVRAARVRLPAAKDFAGWQKDMIGRLRRGPFRNLGEVTTVMSIIRPTRTLVVVDEDKRPPAPFSGEEKEWANDGPVMWLEPCGVGRLKWTRKNPPNYVERSYALLGKTVDLGRVHDILSTLKVHPKPPGEKGWRVVGRGKAGILAAYAALFEPSITEVVVIDPPASHRDGPHFLGVLRVLDIPEALGLLAPRKLTLIGAADPAFNRTAEIYKLAGAADKLTRPEPRSRIDPAGIPGALVLGSEPSDEVLKRFVELAGGKKGKVVVLGAATGDRIAERLSPAEARLHESGKPDLAGVTGVWLAAPAEESACRDYLSKGGVVGSAGKAAGQLARLLPDAVVTFPGGDAKPPTPGLAAYEVGPNAALVVRGRCVGVAGPGKVTVRLATCAARPARAIELSGNQVHDLTALRRAARDRADGFPPARPGAPVVEKGTLVIVGGRGMPPGLLARFVELAGGKEARIVVLPTAQAGPLPRERITEGLRKAGAKKVTVLPGRTAALVESQEYLDAMKEATGIWFGGGRQWRFVDAYEGTKLLPLMVDVLRRGGVIGGSSAGATIQGEYLCRGGVFENFAIAYEGYERGLSFLPGVAIDQHFAQRRRFKDLTQLMKLYPQYLGVGIDEATAIVVKGSVAEVVGKGQAHFYDAGKRPEEGKPDHESVSAGGRYDLKVRKALAE
jgi:cyanophycinase